jgi:hypothetical protein
LIRRLSYAALAPFALALVLGACGGDDDDASDGGDEPTATPTLSAMDAQRATVTAQDQPTVADTPIAKPTPIPDDVPVIQVVGAGKSYLPLRSEFESLPMTEITVDGKKVKGVSLSEVARKVGASSTAVVTIQGTRADNLRLGAVRFTLAEIGENTVLVLDEGGHVSLASSSIPPEQWLTTITGIALN